ncbi:undecaprenyldiphospho-muramoylpentapeptide beta-N-acetylglucosaminyltransferase [Neisseria meningitidis]|nr:undecaprenyldiphospho-muramoylpentapeptide beta-N-acetylglucosaminyltransferase [Neisseria meningitidis]
MGGKTFMLMAGGTGGHIFPALAVADSLRARGHHVIWLGSKDSMEERIVPQYDILLETLAIKGVRGNGIKRKLMLPFTLYQTVREAQQIIRKHRVECVIGFGGFVTFPGGLAAKLLGVPIVDSRAKRRGRFVQPPPVALGEAGVVRFSESVQPRRRLGRQPRPRRY